MPTLTTTSTEQQLCRVVQQFFGDLNQESTTTIASQFTLRHLASGEVFITQGDLADAMYIILSGRVQFELTSAENPTTAPRIVGNASTGESVGEFALLSDGRRTATVRAMRETTVARLSRDNFESLSLTHPQMLRTIASIVVQRRQRSLGVLETEPRVTLAITLMPLNSGCNVQPFLKQLQAAFAPYGDTRVISAESVNEQFACDSIAHAPQHSADGSAISQWLEQQERIYEIIIFVPNGAFDTWTQRCLSHSDRVVFLGRSTDSAELIETEQQITRRFPHLRQSLALWHSADTAHPTGTANWLAPRDLQTHYHVRDGDATHFSRLARRLSGRAIGLALCGGGARGFVHLGVFDALAESGVPIDYIGGTSFGAIAGICRARDMSTAEYIEHGGHIVSDRRYLFDRTLPMVALNRSKRFTTSMKALYGDWQMEDLWIPFFVIATNLTQLRMEVIERGPVWEALRQSSSIPAVYVPYIKDDDLIVDGGVTNNFPVDVLIDKAESTRIIGVRCDPSSEKKRTYDMQSEMSGWRVLLNRLNPFARSLRIPSLANTVMRSMVINGQQMAIANMDRCELMLHPKPRGYGILAFEKYKEIIAVGYEQSAEQIHVWAQQQPDL